MLNETCIINNINIDDLIKKLDQGLYIDDSLKSFMDNINYNIIFYFDPHFYKNIWEHKKIKPYNKEANILNNYFCTIYKYDLEQDNYIFIYGRLGNTTVFEFKLKGGC